MIKNDIYKFKDVDIKVWYTTIYPHDELGEILNNVTFYELSNCLDRHKDVYEFLGVGDSIIRERVFNQLAIIMNVGYDYIYNQWLLTV